MKMQPFEPSYADILELETFFNHIEDGDLYDSDGQGFYGTPTHYDLDAPARPSAVIKGHLLNNGYSYVHWFNK
jgi:hypothetical protein